LARFPAGPQAGGGARWQARWERGHGANGRR